MQIIGQTLERKIRFTLTFRERRIRVIRWWEKKKESSESYFKVDVTFYKYFQLQYTAFPAARVSKKYRLGLVRVESSRISRRKNWKFTRFAIYLTLRWRFYHYLLAGNYFHSILKLFPTFSMDSGDTQHSRWNAEPYRAFIFSHSRSHKCPLERVSYKIIIIDPDCRGTGW